MSKKITWISAQNLIGGMAYAAEKELGMPAAIVTGFAGNDNQYINYTNVQRGKNVPVIKFSPDYKQKLEGIDVPEVDLWMMTPICAGLSRANSSTKDNTKPGNPDNRQNQNMYNMIDVAMRYNAKVIAFENAPALAQNMGTGVRNRLKEIADANGYSMQLLYTDTIKHGIPQSRKRTFAIFFKGDKCYRFNYENANTPNMVDYLKQFDQNLSHNKPLMDINKDEFLNALKNYCKKDTLAETFQCLAAKMPPKVMTALNVMYEIGYDNFDPWLAGNRFFERAKTKAVFDCTWVFPFRNSINALIYKCLYNTIHPDFSQGRALTERECMHMMGIPPEFEPSEGYSPVMITQNVPVCTANYIVRNCVKALSDELENVDPAGKIYLQNNLKQTETFV